MNHVEWRPLLLEGFSNYILSNKGQLKRTSFISKSGSYRKERTILCRSRRGNPNSIQVVLTSDSGKLYYKSLSVLIHSTFPEIDELECRNIAVNYYHKQSKSREKYNEDEVWKDCIGFEDSYAVSSYGRVKRKSKVLTKSDGNKYTVESYVLKAWITKDNCCRVHMRLGSRQVFKQVHRIVAETFIPNPANLKYVLHKDGNNLNNHVNNLEWSDYNDFHRLGEIFCIETKILYPSIYSLIRELKMSLADIRSHVVDGKSIQGKHYICWKDDDFKSDI